MMSRPSHLAPQWKWRQYTVELEAENKRLRMSMPMIEMRQIEKENAKYKKLVPIARAVVSEKEKQIKGVHKNELKLFAYLIDDINKQAKALEGLE
jgi:hypothetical protein